MSRWQTHVFAFHVPESSRSESRSTSGRSTPKLPSTWCRRRTIYQSELERFLRDAAQDRYATALPGRHSGGACFDEARSSGIKPSLQGATLRACRDPPIRFCVLAGTGIFVVEQDGRVLPPAPACCCWYWPLCAPDPALPVLDYQRIDTAFDNWSAEQRRHDRYVVLKNIFQTWQGS